MKGLITPIIICSLAAAPLAFAVLKVPRKLFIASASAVGIASFGCYIAFAGFGYHFVENLSGSLNGNIYVYKAGEPFKKGDIVAYRWNGGMNYAPGSVFIKRVAGAPGDTVRREGRTFYVAGQYIGLAKTVAKTGEPLEAASAGVIPPGQYFLATPSPDSLDSRYAVTGNVKEWEIIGKAYELF